jgi:hypothetical protein
MRDWNRVREAMKSGDLIESSTKRDPTGTKFLSISWASSTLVPKKVFCQCSNPYFLVRG